MKKNPIAVAATYTLLAGLAFVLLFPLLYAISGSLMTAREISTYPPAFLPSQPRLNNFVDVLRALPIPRQYLNSLIVAACVMVGQLATSILSAYAFAFLRMPFRNLIFGIFLATMMVPWEAVIIPNYLTMAQYHLINSYPALILPFLAAGFGTFLLRQFFLSFPKDLYEAAVLDGSGHLRFLWSILLPLSRPALAALAIWSFLSAWNQFLWPLLVINRDEMQTLQIGISRLQDVEAGTAPNFILAGTVLALIPTLLLIYFGQRHIVRGLTAGALRG
ncbi:MAG TPA: carbohydrate ABC transporter permease [Candidatus Eisenbacteria bacterium]|nr:carbohydrate ABC transporter permease [Candidatus Eisenbacteria bacterium]